MKELLDAFWRAAAYCLHPRVVAMSLLPLALAAGTVIALSWFFWEGAVASLRSTLESWSLVAAFLSWLESIGGSGLGSVMAPMIVVALSVPVIVIASLLLVAVFMAPALVNLVAKRRFATLDRKRGASIAQSVLWSLGSTLAALLALVVSMPLWLVPPLILLLPPLIWGWLTYRVMSFDALADHASSDERRTILRQHRLPLLAIGIITGYLGAAPSVLWAFGAVTLVLAPFLAVASVWIYTLVFAFSALWFTHYALAALQSLRDSQAPSPPVLVPSVPAFPAVVPPA